MNSKPIPLEARYDAEVDCIKKYEWYKILDQFSDANIYQTWSYDTIRCEGKNISHLVTREAGQIIAAAQARIVRLPFFGFGAAYIRWGPFWQLKNQVPNPAAFRLAIRAVRNEYVCRRGLILRIFPALYNDNSNLYLDILLQEGYSLVTGKNQARTLILDISPSTDDLRKNLDQKWRNCLNKAERNQLEIIEGTDDSLFTEFIGIYQDLLKRKQFKKPNDINEFRMIQRELPDEFKMRIFLCRSNGLNSAGAIFSVTGETGVYLFGAINDQGMANKGSYLIQWKAIQWMKNIGCQYYNLNGINPIINPGTYHFKAGLAGKCCKDVYYLGRFDCYSGSISAALVRTADSVFPFLRGVISVSGLLSKPKP